MFSQIIMLPQPSSIQARESFLKINSMKSISDHLTFSEALARLMSSPHVDGIAEFGSRSAGGAAKVSDYDLLLLVKALPRRVFQLVTTINGRLADIVLLEVATAEALLATKSPPSAKTIEAMFVQKMQSARILYDASGRLQKIQQLATSPDWIGARASSPSEYEAYALRFWLSHGLMHLERMAGADDPLHNLAAEMMLTSCLAYTWRSYFEARKLAWQGEKAAIRHWEAQDDDYLLAVRKCLASQDLLAKVAQYRVLVILTLAPIGSLIDKGETAVALAGPVESLDAIQKTLGYWNSLFEVRPQL
jgi:hypothetical protein